MNFAVSQNTVASVLRVTGNRKLLCLIKQALCQSSENIPESK